MLTALKNHCRVLKRKKLPSYKLSCYNEALFAFFAVTLKSAPTESTEAL